MKLFIKIIECIFSPFTVLIQSNAKPDPNKYVRPLVVIGISIVVTALICLLVYRGVFFQ